MGMPEAGVTGAATPPVLLPARPAAMSDEQGHAQAVAVTAGEEELFPPHPPREDTPEYRATHKLLAKTLDQPCEICGVRNSTLGDAAQNPFGARDIETHHWPVQRELIDATDWQKVARDFKQVTDRPSLLMFVDSPANMKVLCDIHHRDKFRGIHHLVANDWVIQKYLFDGYVLVDDAKHAAADVASDSALVDAAVPEAERA